ncbi:hypothetical protein [Mycoplasmopsis columboralis]|uniref:Uncharacterized protein n=1 Tax=Mycoplasmopsis columboralis TaxID=171282 RepID=A0A449B5K2_9BACT|nr:hypothetical protein [Mycoplasmopsis columboralis]VEU75849.1 Uncharacterised protein [Mycoplasmopsis columboralis]
MKTLSKEKQNEIKEYQKTLSESQLKEYVSLRRKIFKQKELLNYYEGSLKMLVELYNLDISLDNLKEIYKILKLDKSSKWVEISFESKWVKSYKEWYEFLDEDLKSEGIDNSRALKWSLELLNNFNKNDKYIGLEFEDEEELELYCKEEIMLWAIDELLFDKKKN